MKNTPVLITLCLAALSLPALAGSGSDPKTQLKTSLVDKDLKSSGAGWKPGDPITAADGLLGFDVQERLRWEIRDNNFDFNSGVNAITDDNYLLQRLRVGMTIKADTGWKLYLQAQDSREIGSKRPDDPGRFGSEGDSQLGLSQANVSYSDTKATPLGGTLGRQQLAYGDERLVGTFDWNNIGRFFDGLKMRYTGDKWWLDGFAVMPVNMRENHFNDTDYKDRFVGLYFHSGHLEFQTTEFYAFFRNKEDVDAGFPTGGTTFETDQRPNTAQGTQKGDYATLGARVKSAPGKLDGWDYTAEIAGQVGTIVGNSQNTSIVNATTRRRDLLAMAANIGAGFTFQEDWKPRLGAGYAYASGDDSTGDATSASFQGLFHTNHKFYGFMDFFAWRNIHDPYVTFSVEPVKTVKLSLDYNAFWLASTGDGWFRANSYTQVRPIPPGGNVSSFVGQEIDLTVSWEVTKWFKVLAGYSHFFSGDYVRATGPGSDADFGYIQTTFSF